MDSLSSKEHQESLFYPFTSDEIADALYYLIRIKAFLVRGGIEFFLPALGGRCQWDKNADMKVSRTELSFTIYYPTEDNLRKGMEKIKLFHDYEQLPTLHHKIHIAPEENSEDKENSMPNGHN